MRTVTSRDGRTIAVRSDPGQARQLRSNDAIELALHRRDR